MGAVGAPKPSPPVTLPIPVLPRKQHSHYRFIALLVPPGRFSTPAARVRYLRDALTAYKALFGDMDSFLERYVGELRNQGFPIP